MSSSCLPAEILEIILSNLVLADNKILWSRRYHPTRGLDIRLSLVCKSFKRVCEALFYSGNVFQFFNEDELSQIIDTSGHLVSSCFRHIELMQAWSTWSLQPMTNTEKLWKWVDSAKCLKKCHNLRTLRIHHVTFSNWKLANDFDGGMHRITGCQPDYVAFKLLNLIECPGAFHNGRIYLNDMQQEYTVVREGFEYRSRPFEVLRSKDKLLEQTEIVQLAQAVHRSHIRDSLPSRMAHNSSDQHTSELIATVLFDRR